MRRRWGWGQGWVALDDSVVLGRPRTTAVRGVPSFLHFNLVSLALSSNRPRSNYM